jgi:lipase
MVPTPWGDLAVWEWPGAGPPLVFTHATGFHGRVWDRVAGAFPDRRRLAIEFRGHGRSVKPEPPCSWTWFAEDVIQACDGLGARGGIGIGHSLGGHALAAAAIRCPGLFSALLLVDPVILRPERYAAPPPDAGFIRRRRAHWESPAALLHAFRGRPPFAGWNPRVLRDYCDFALLDEGGRWTLACAPEFEASVYERCNAPDANLYSEIGTITVPVTVLRATRDTATGGGKLDLNASPTWPGLAALFPRGRQVLREGASHYIPMESPEIVEREIRTLA